MKTLISLLIAYSLFANTGAKFLKISLGARESATGAFSAIADEVTSIHINPAGLAQISMKEIALSYSQYIADTNLSFFGFLLPINKLSNIAGGITHLSYGHIELRDENRKILGSFSANDLSITLNYSRKIKDLLIGINFKYIQQQIESHKATGFALDVGYLATLSSLKYGLTLQNIGPQMKFINEAYNLPLTLTAGISYQIKGLKIILDVKNSIYENKTSISIGSEYTLLPVLTLRGGGLAGSTGLTNLNTGVGINLHNTKLNYSLTSSNSLGNTHHITLCLRF